MFYTILLNVQYTDAKGVFYLYTKYSFVLSVRVGLLTLQIQKKLTKNLNSVIFTIITEYVSKLLSNFNR